MLFEFIIPSCDYYSMGSFLMYKKSERAVVIITVGHRPFSVQNVAMTVYLFVCADKTGDQAYVATAQYVYKVV